LIVQGAGFSSIIQYKCLFNGIGLLQEQISSIAFVNSPTLLSCSSPRSEATLLWNMEMQATISISANNFTIPFQGSNPTQTHFTYSTTGWSSSTPLQSYTTGGVLLTVAGTGFASNGWIYEAIFSAGTFRASSKCIISSLFALKCPVPGICFSYFFLYTPVANNSCVVSTD